MKIIVGLGNPGSKYTHTRHNAGFLAIDHFLKGVETIHCQSKFKSAICEVHFSATKTFFIKPQSYMNNSGIAVKEVLDFYKVQLKDLLVIHDEKDLSFGTIKYTESSRSAGHNGVQDIIDQLGTQDFARIRIGIESRSHDSKVPTDEYVLQKFTEDEFRKLNKEIFPEASKLIKHFIVPKPN